IWLTTSPDLIHWGNSRILIKPMPYHWDELKIGPAAPPLKTARGWLIIYHGVFATMAGAVYRLGLALLDLQDPAKVISVCDRWLLQPTEPYEVTGYVPNVVFSCGAVPEPDGTLKIYWGGADQVMCMGTAKLEELVDFCLKYPRPPL
ncbi:MAG: glycosidase, partial [bacterium]